MTEEKHDLDWFLDVYVPNVLRPMGGWVVQGEEGFIRRPLDDTQASCPLTAERGLGEYYFDGEAVRLGLVVGACSEIISAADNDPEADPAIRARLLAGLGLQERT